MYNNLCFIKVIMLVDMGYCNMKNSIYIIVFGLLISDIVMASCRMQITQDAPVLTSLDIGLQQQGKTQGNILFGEALLRSNGIVVGDLGLMITTIDASDPEGSGRERFNDRFGNLEFRFNEVDTLIVSGTTKTQPNETRIPIGEPQYTAVIGGTGQFKFARGQVVTTRMADNSYTHKFELDGPRSMCQLRTKLW